MPLISQWVNPAYLDKRRIIALRKQFERVQPFPHIALKDLLKKEKLQQLEQAVHALGFSRKEADLFSFSQSADLYTTDDPVIQEFLKLLQSAELTAIVNAIADVQIKRGKVDASAFIYSDCDHLLCHDDGVSSRRIAYIFNLSSLRKGQGGTLSLLGSDNKNRPTRIVKRIIPKKNTFIIFKVTSRSHHQVEEVIKAKRVTVTGWFHA
jgi:prolyl 3-hydroxylase /prolyl 3,4-dihydroxylase